LNYIRLHSPGELTPKVGLLACNSFLAKLALRGWSTGPPARGMGSSATGNSSSSSNDAGRIPCGIVSDTFEALIGAVYLDCCGDMIVVRQVIMSIYGDLTERLQYLEPSANPKTRLQEWAQGFRGSVQYRSMRIGGQDHAPLFESEVTVSVPIPQWPQGLAGVVRDGHMSCSWTGTGSSHREADQRAADVGFRWLTRLTGSHPHTNTINLPLAEAQASSAS